MDHPLSGLFPPINLIHQLFSFREFEIRNLFRFLVQHLTGRIIFAIFYHSIHARECFCSYYVSLLLFLKPFLWYNNLHFSLSVQTRPNRIFLEPTRSPLVGLVLLTKPHNNGNQIVFGNFKQNT